MAKLTLAEQETTIQWSQADRVAHVFSASRPVAARISKIRGGKQVSVSRGPAGEWWGELWELPIPCVIPRQRRLGRVLTPAEIAKMQNHRVIGRKRSKETISND